MSESADTRQFKLDHRWARAQMSAYVDGELTNPRRRRMESHLARCERCRQLLASLRGTVAAVQALASPASPTSPHDRATAVIARLNG
jgi:anti-sigma factor RsiW